MFLERLLVVGLLAVSLGCIGCDSKPQGDGQRGNAGKVDGEVGPVATSQTQPAARGGDDDAVLKERLRPWESLNEVEVLRTAVGDLVVEADAKDKIDRRLDEVAATLNKTLDGINERDPSKSAEAAARIQRLVERATSDVKQALGPQRWQEAERRLSTIKVQCVMLMMGPDKLDDLWDSVELEPSQRKQVDSLVWDLVADAVPLAQNLRRSSNPAHDLMALSSKTLGTRQRIRALLTPEQVRRMDIASGLDVERPISRPAP